MNGVPQVRAAFLNGVNPKIRDQYAGQALSALRIPRHVVAKAGAFDFTFHVDEAGTVGKLVGPQTWLGMRAFVASGHRGGNEEQHEREGVRILLEEIIPSTIKANL